MERLHRMLPLCSFAHLPSCANGSSICLEVSASDGRSPCVAFLLWASARIVRITCRAITRFRDTVANSLMLPMSMVGEGLHAGKNTNDARMQPINDGGVTIVVYNGVVKPFSCLFESNVFVLLVRCRKGSIP